MDDCSTCEYLDYCKSPHFNPGLGNPCGLTLPGDAAALDRIGKIMEANDIGYLIPLF